MKVMTIAQNTPYRLRTPQRSFHVGAKVTAADLGIDPPKFLASMLPPPPTAVCLDMKRGVVSLMRQRRPRIAPPTALAESAREAHITLTHAVALRARMAESREDIDDAHHLVRRRYAWRGYDLPANDAQAPKCVEPHSNHVVFVAKEGSDTVGTITLGLDSHTGLLAEGTYPDVVQERRAAGCNVCEVTRLAVAERVESKSVLAALFSLAFATASVHGVTDVFVEVNPRHVVFYRRVLGFMVAAGEKFCERVKAPSVLLWLTMDELEQRLMKLNAKIASQPLEAQAA